MRLICPKCDAEYEVEAAAIPETGRDVQCSNCGHGWYQMPAEAAVLSSTADDDLAPAMAAALAADVRPRAANPAAEPPAAQIDSPAQPLPDPAAGLGGADSAGLAGADATEAEAMEDATDAAVDDPMAAPVRPRALEQSVLSVLREEAEREAAARRAEMARSDQSDSDTPIETGPEAEVEPAQSPTGLLSENVVEKVAEPVVQASPVLIDPVLTEPALTAPALTATTLTGPTLTAGAALQPGEVENGTRRHGRDLLPDVEEINTTLCPVVDDGSCPSESQQAQLPAEGTPMPARARSGFGSGFALMIILAGVMVALYVLAPKLSAQIPAIRPAMEQYVATVDMLRLHLDGWMKSAIIAINGQS